MLDGHGIFIRTIKFISKKSSMALLKFSLPQSAPYDDNDDDDVGDELLVECCEQPYR